jgi:hypothetical protein
VTDDEQRLEGVAMKRSICTVLLMTLLALCGASDAAGADKPRKSTPKRERLEASNASTRTQQRTGDAMAEKTGRPTTPAKTEGKAETPDDARAALEEVERRLSVEIERFTAALAELRAAEQAAVRSGKAKSVATARKAIDRETSAHERKKAPLLEQRDALLRKLGLEPAPADGAGERPREAKGRTSARAAD